MAASNLRSQIENLRDDNDRLAQERDAALAKLDARNNLLLGVVWAYAATTWTWNDQEPRDVLDEGLYEALVGIGDGRPWCHVPTKENKP